MKFNENILKQFNLTPEEEKEPVNIMRVSEMLLMIILTENYISRN